MGQDQLKELVTAKYNNDAINKDDIKIENEPAKENNNYKPGLYGIVFKVEKDSKVTTKTTLLKVKANDIPEELDTKKEIKLSFWHAMADNNFELLKTYANQFHQKYPNITVEVPARASNTGYYDALKETVVTSLNTTEYPNIVQSYADHVMEYFASGKVLNLDQYIYHPTHGLHGADALDDILLAYRNENRAYDYERTYYSLPFNKSTEVVQYNKDVFDRLGLEMPATWQDLIAIAPQLKTEGDRIQKEKVMAKHNITTEAQITPAIATEIKNAQDLFVPITYEDNPNMFITFARQWGGKYISIDENRKGQLHFQDDPNVKAAMQFLKDNTKHITMPSFFGQRFLEVPYKNQQTFVVIGSNSGVRYQVDKKNEFITNTAPLFYNKEKPEYRQVVQQGTNITLLSHNDPQVDLASWLFLKFLVSKETTLNWGLKTGYVPVRTSAHNSAEYQELLNKPLSEQDAASLAANAAIAQRDYYFYDPAFPGSAKVRTLVGEVVKRIMTGDGNIDGAIASAYDGAKTSSGIK